MMHANGRHGAVSKDSRLYELSRAGEQQCLSVHRGADLQRRLSGFFRCPAYVGPAQLGLGRLGRLLSAFLPCVFLLLSTLASTDRGFVAAAPSEGRRPACLSVGRQEKTRWFCRFLPEKPSHWKDFSRNGNDSNLSPASSPTKSSRASARPGASTAHREPCGSISRQHKATQILASRQNYACKFSPLTARHYHDYQRLFQYACAQTTGA